MRSARRDPTFEEAFDELYPRALRLAYRMLGDRAAAEDLAAEAMARTFLHWPRVRDLAYRDAWVLRTTANLAIGLTRRHRPTLARQPAPPTPEDATATRTMLVAALNRLPRRQREAVTLRFLADMSEEQVASALGVASGTVKSHVHRGLASLRLMLGPEFKEVLVVP